MRSGAFSDIPSVNGALLKAFGPALPALRLGEAQHFPEGVMFDSTVEWDVSLPRLQLMTETARRGSLTAAKLAFSREAGRARFRLRAHQDQLWRYAADEALRRVNALGSGYV